MTAEQVRTCRPDTCTHYCIHIETPEACNSSGTEVPTEYGSKCGYGFSPEIESQIPEQLEKRLDII